MTLVLSALIAPVAQAAVVVSSAATQNMSCESGVCAPTAATAVLNVDDLETLLASGNTAVTTTGQGIQAHDIDIKAPLTWPSSSVLTLDSDRSLTVDQPVSVAGLSGLVLQAGREYSFGKSGNVTFANLSSSLSIDGSSYTLVGDLKTLAADIAADPSGDFALANSYDASGDGIYDSSPVGIFSGTFDGLGNDISNLSIDGGTQVDGGTRVATGTFEGLFAEITSSGILRSVGLSNASIVVPENLGVRALGAAGSFTGMNLGIVRSCVATGSLIVEKAKPRRYPYVGGLLGWNYGTVAYSHTAIKVRAKHSNSAGGLVSYNLGSIGESYTTGDILGDAAGGLVGFNADGTVTKSYSTGRVVASQGGSLIGANYASVTNSYATGSVINGVASQLGGLVGLNVGKVSSSYSTGSVRGGMGSLIGGLIGDDQSQSGSLDDTYWDTDTSGITDPSQGAGNIANDPGITGLTTAQFQSGIPAGFDPKVWGQKAGINGGLPYLIANRPGRK